MTSKLPRLTACLAAGFALHASAAPPVPPSEVCSLLSAAQIQSVQGEQPTQAKSDHPAAGGLRISQCYFALPTLSKSISLTLTERGAGANGVDPRKQWYELFHRKAEPAGDKAGEEKEDEGRPAPQDPVKGLGDEAWWASSPVGGTLYVLKGHRYFRLSVGGPGTPAEKEKKSVKLARMILKRL